MNKIPVGKYKELKKGEIYTYRTVGKEEALYRTGKLISVSTKWKEDKDEDGKVTNKTLIGDRLIFEPGKKDAVYDWKEEKLRIFAVVVGCGLFEIFERV
jgi:hypothetical protein